MEIQPFIYSSGSHALAIINKRRFQYSEEEVQLTAIAVKQLAKMADNLNPKDQQPEPNPLIADLSVEEDLYNASPISPPARRSNAFTSMLGPAIEAFPTAIQRLGIQASAINFANDGNNKILQDGVNHITGICERLARIDDLYTPNGLDRKGYALLVKLRAMVQELDVFVEKMNPDVVDVEDPERSSLPWWEERERALGFGAEEVVTVADQEELNEDEGSEVDPGGAMGAKAENQDQNEGQDQDEDQAEAVPQAPLSGPTRIYAYVASAGVQPGRVVSAQELGIALRGNANGR